MRVGDGYSAVRHAPVVGLRGQAVGCVGADDGSARFGDMRTHFSRHTIAASAELANSSCRLLKRSPHPYDRTRVDFSPTLFPPPLFSEQRALALQTEQPEDPCGHSRPPSVVTHA